MIVKQKDSKPMDDVTIKVLAMFTIGNIPEEGVNTVFEDMIEMSSFFYGVMIKRIEVLKLPMEIDKKAWIYMLSFLDRVGVAVLVLIDILEYLDERDYPENNNISLEDLVQIYPFGFYNDTAAMKRIDDIKDKKYSSEWCRIY